MNGKSLREIDPTTDGRWDTFVAQTRGSSVFQHSAWKNVIQKTFHARPLYLAVEDGEGTIKSGIPFFFKKSFIAGRALISLPFSDYCDILGDDGEDLQMLLERAVEWGNENGARYIEIRTRSDSNVNLEQYALERDKTYLNHFLEVKEDLEFMEKKVIEKSYKYDIRQAVKSGLVVTAATGESEMKQYYRLYLMTRSYHGLPPVPYAFFKNVWDILAPLKMVYLFLARWMEQPVAGIIFLRHHDTLYALSASSDRRFLDKKPNHLLWWRGIQLAAELHLTGLDFGRTSLDNKGLRFFKKRWGTRELEIYHYRHQMGRKQQNHKASRTGIEKELTPILKAFPPWALQFVGNIAYRHLY